MSVENSVQKPYVHKFKHNRAKITSEPSSRSLNRVRSAGGNQCVYCANIGTLTCNASIICEKYKIMLLGVNA